MKRRLALIFILALLAAGITGGFAFGNVYAEESVGSESEKLTPEELLEQTDISGLSDYFETLNGDQRAVFGTSLYEYLEKIVSGEFEFGYSSFFTYMMGALGLSIVKILPMLLSIIAVAVLISFIGGMKGSFASQSVDNIVNFAGIALVSAIVLLQIFGIIRETAALVTTLKGQMEAVFPILFTMMTALGASGSMAIYQPAVAVLAFSVTELISVIALPMLIITIVFSVIGNLSGTVKLGGMAKFFISAAKWILYTSFFLFLAFLSIQGITAAVYDSISVRTAKFALSKYVPVIGGYLSEGFNVILAGTVLIKNAVGLTAVIIMFVSIVPVLFKVIIVSLALKLAGALTEPFEGGRIAGLLNSVSSAVNLLVAIICGIVFLYFVFLLLVIASGNLVL
ncbi:MAG: stage III sporulation protein AE [Christensenellales bacterium]|jgi:stage III sporulation protein AE